MEHFISSLILLSLVFCLQSCCTFRLFYNRRILTTRLSCNNIILQKILKTTTAMNPFCSNYQSKKVNRVQVRAFTDLFYLRSFLRSVVFYFQSFYTRSFYAQSFYVRSFSTFSHSTFGLSTFGHSTFGHSFRITYKEVSQNRHYYTKQVAFSPPYWALRQWFYMYFLNLFMC